MNQITQDIYKNLELLPLNLTGWNGTNEIFSKLIKIVQPKNIIEVGTWRGQSAITMAKVIQELKLPTKITCVDTWLGAVEFWDTQKHTPERDLMLKNGYPQAYYQFLSNVVHNKCEDIILPFPNTSFIAARYFQHSGFKAQLIYIDGSHEYEDVYQDNTQYWQVLENGGILFGDDFGWKSVADAVKQFAADNKLEIINEGRDFWYIKKA